MKTKIGFTLTNEAKALLVIAIFALTFGAVMLIANRPRGTGPGGTRIDATRTTLEMGLSNFRAVEGRWPVTLVSQGTNQIVFREDNALVFAPLIKDAKYLDVAALLTKVPGQGVLPLNKALKKGIAPEQCPLGYLDPSNKEIFNYFKVTFNLDYDIVKVER
jgi:hypothetical protein